MNDADAKTHLYALGRADLERLVLDLGHSAYRADQLWHWMYRRLASSFDEMSNLPRPLLRQLAESARLDAGTVALVTTSADALADKALLAMQDGQLVETVLMHYGDPADEPGGDDQAPAGRRTACLSTQVGCAMGCAFCATGQMGLLRDLGRGEVVEQAVWAGRRLAASGRRLTNVVFMGMGEPLANWTATWGAVETLSDPGGFGLGARRITISTVGLVPGILRLAETDRPVRLAVSLHAPDDELRSRLVAINEAYGLDAILDACRVYQSRGGRRITFEYVMIDGINDRPDQARALARRLRGLVAHVNLIPLNPTAGSAWRPSSDAAVGRFRAVLESAGIPTTARLRRGIEIDAGCGQLRTRAAAGLVGRTARRQAVVPRVGPPDGRGAAADAARQGEP